MNTRGKSGQNHVFQNDLLELVGYNMKRAYMCINQDFGDALADLNLRQRTFSVLSLVIENPNVSQSQVARSLGIERSGTVVIVDELENRGLIRRDRVAGDRRAYALAATDDGQVLYKNALARIKKHEDGLLSTLTDADRASLIHLLQRIHTLKT